MDVTEERLEAVAAAFRTGARTYESIGSPLYAALCRVGADSSEAIGIAAHAMAGAQPVFHMLTAIHYLLLAEPVHPLARFFATISETPLPPEEARPHFLAFCHVQREAIIETLRTSTVQTTFVERCITLLPPLAWVADRIGEPLHLIEIGCSAGVLLTFDRYAYSINGGPTFGNPEAPLTLSGEILGDPPLRVPQIASRIGLDLNPLDVCKERDRRWLNAQIFPEYRQQREQLNVALDVVADTPIRMIAGDALATLREILNQTADPVCIFHSVCLSYWSEEARTALDDMLIEASRDRTFYRIGSEPSRAFSAWNKGHDRSGSSKPRSSGEVEIVQYAKGGMTSRIVATTDTHRPVEWLI